MRELNLIDYRHLLREAYIHRLMQYEEGRKYLHNCWRMEQTEPEADKLREKYGKDNKRREK